MLRSLRSLRKRRVVLGVLLVWLLYTFFKNMPTDLPSMNERTDSRYGRLANPYHLAAGHGPEAPTTHDDYDGPIRYFSLGATLQRFAHEPSHTSTVLFVFASPKASSRALAAACVMAARQRAVVHLATMGLEPVEFSHLLRINRIPQDDCPLHWHDAQADFARHSSKGRLSKAVEGAFGHLHRTLTLQAVFYDRSDDEFDYLRASIESAARSYEVTSLSIPGRDAWTLTLDGDSLSEMNRLQIDVLIRVQPESSGSLLRLLRSIEKADYGTLAHPRIVLELPARTDQRVLEHLAGFVWPPWSQPAGSRFTIRHRVDDKPLNPATASLQMVESFYPATGSSHVLVLSPEIEVSPNYYQVLAYLVLEYRYSARTTLLKDGLMGISLLQTSYKGSSTSPIILHQDLSGNAELFFGDRWAEFHQYLSLRLTADPTLSTSLEDPSTDIKKTRTWTRLAAELMQSQGYAMLQPRYLRDGTPLARLHSELQPLAEEFPLSKRPTEASLRLTTDADVLGAQAVSNGGPEAHELSRAAVLSVVAEFEQSGGPFIGYEDVPFYNSHGRLSDRSTIHQQALAYAQRLSTQVGGCADSEHVQTGDMELLFC